MIKRCSGYTLVEWMIAIVLGLFIFGGLLSLYVISNETTSNSLDNGELQENGRIAMNLLLRDLRMAGFWGDYTGLPLALDSGVTLSAAASGFDSSNDCLDNRGVGSFPEASLNLRSVWVIHVDNSGNKGSALSCISLPSGAVLAPNTDIIDIKRTIGESVLDSDSLDSDHYYAATTVHALQFFKGSETRPTMAAMANRQIWQYARHIYYISSQNSVPELHMMYLMNTVIDNSIVRGVERMRLLFAVDTSVVPDGIIDAFVRPESITQQQWDERRVIGGRIFLLIRSIEPSNEYTNPNTYLMGDISYTPADHYRRLLLQSTVMFNNSGDYAE